MTAGLEVGKSGEVVFYEAPDGQVALDLRLEQDTVWLTQGQMAELFSRERSVITKHINNVFGENELAKKSNVQNLHIASSDKQEGMMHQLAPQTLTALALLIAESAAANKDLMIRLIMNLLTEHGA